ncbi:MAG: hypothetical protein M0R80_29560 [Proteobacteria bacterium]|jgi:hypothetical protein|nr:hypothetical protein [Pseudomonadota bacterium]
MSIIKRENKLSIGQGVGTPKNDKLTVANKGEIYFAGRTSSFTLDANHPVYKLYVKIAHGLPGNLYTNVGAMAIVNSVSKDADGGISRIEPWTNSGLYYHDGTDSIHYRRQYFLTTDYILVTQTYRFLGTGSVVFGSGPAGYLQWQALNTNTAYVSAAYEELGDEGTSGYYLYYDERIFNSKGTLIGTTTDTFQYDTADWAYEPSGKWWKY